MQLHTTAVPSELQVEKHDVLIKVSSINTEFEAAERQTERLKCCCITYSTIRR